MTQRGWIIQCPYCTWGRFAHTQAACSTAYTVHARTKHKDTTAPPPAAHPQLNLEGDTP